MKKILLAVFVLFFVTVDANCTTVKSHYYFTMPEEVRISGCDASPCIHYKGEILQMEIDFTCDREIKDICAAVYMRIYASGSFYTLPISIWHCDLAPPYSFPLRAGSSATVLLELSLEDTFPSMTGDICVEISSVERGFPLTTSPLVGFSYMGIIM